LAKLQEKLLQFGKSRPIIIQLTSQEENVTKIYYKDEIAAQFISIDQQGYNFEEIINFPSFLWSFLDGKFSNIEHQVPKLLLTIPNSSLKIQK